MFRKLFRKVIGRERLNPEEFRGNPPVPADAIEMQKIMAAHAKAAARLAKSCELPGCCADWERAHHEDGKVKGTGR